MDWKKSEGVVKTETGYSVKINSESDLEQPEIITDTEFYKLSAKIAIGCILGISVVYTLIVTYMLWH